MQDPRLQVDISRFREIVKLGEIEVHWVNKTHQLSDTLTKYGATAVRLKMISNAENFGMKS